MKRFLVAIIGGTVLALGITMLNQLYLPWPVTRTYAVGCANKRAWAFWVITVAAGCMILRSAVIA